MTLLPLLQATDAAEARGDALAALEMIELDLTQRQDLGFWRPERVQRLLQLHTFGRVLPRWATSRWILAQAAQWLDTSNRERSLRSLDVARDVSGAALLPGKDLVDQQAKVMDHDWVYRQMFLYELGGLQHFLRHHASADLVAGADRIHEWARAPMRGLRFLHETPQTLTWCDLASDEEIQTVNIGSASLLERGECAIGRVVPSDVGLLFETAPLFVLDEVARRVSAEPHGWLTALSDGFRDAAPDDPVMLTAGHDVSLLTDVPGFVRRQVIGDVSERIHGRRVTVEAVADVDALELRFIRAAVDGHLPDGSFGALGISPLPTVAATLLQPTLLPLVADHLVAQDGPGLRRLADRLPSPAAQICRSFADELEPAA